MGFPALHTKASFYSKNLPYTSWIHQSPHLSRTLTEEATWCLDLGLIPWEDSMELMQNCTEQTSGCLGDFVPP